MPGRRLAVLPGLAAAIVIALVGRGGLFHYAACIYLLGIALGLAVIAWLIARFRKRDGKYSASGIALVGVLQLASIPMGARINRWDVSRAKAWCEKAVHDGSRLPQAFRIKQDDPGGRPALVMYDPARNDCTVVDRTMMMGGWAYNESTGRWTYWN